MTNAKLAKAKQIKVKCMVCGKTFTRRQPNQRFCSRACVSRKYAGHSRIHRTRREVREHVYVGNETGVTRLAEKPLPPAIQKRIDMIVAAEMARRLA